MNELPGAPEVPDSELSAGAGLTARHKNRQLQDPPAHRGRRPRHGVHGPEEHPVRRKVALKVIKPGMDTRLVMARFESERQALALMDHPNIDKDCSLTDLIDHR